MLPPVSVSAPVAVHAAVVPVALATTTTPATALEGPLNVGHSGVTEGRDVLLTVLLPLRGRQPLTGVVAAQAVEEGVSLAVGRLGSLAGSLRLLRGGVGGASGHRLVQGVGSSLLRNLVEVEGLRQSLLDRLSLLLVVRLEVHACVGVLASLSALATLASSADAAAAAAAPGAHALSTVAAALAAADVGGAAVAALAAATAVAPVGPAAVPVHRRVVLVARGRLPRLELAAAVATGAGAAAPAAVLAGSAEVVVLARLVEDAACRRVGGVGALSLAAVGGGAVHALRHGDDRRVVEHVLQHRQGGDVAALEHDLLVRVVLGRDLLGTGGAALSAEHPDIVEGDGVRLRVDLRKRALVPDVRLADQLYPRPDHTRAAIHCAVFLYVPQ
eukprot:Rhum_TRINITY_DN14345_c18_g1::Rhum_TRINITY_DN14345_c18_g1_i1::g.84886::m.84886